MFILSTLEFVRFQYPEAFEDAVHSFRKSRSKRKGEPLVSFEWGFDFYVQVPTLKFGDIVSGAAERSRAEFDALSVEEKVQDYERRCGVTIVGRLTGRVHVQSTLLERIPMIILEQYRQQLLTEQIERRRVAALSQEERQRGLDSAVHQLESGPGFHAFGLHRKG